MEEEKSKINKGHLILIIACAAITVIAIIVKLFFEK